MNPRDGSMRSADFDKKDAGCEPDARRHAHRPRNRMTTGDRLEPARTRMSVGDDMLHHVPRLRRYARALLGNRELADDLVQDTLERGLRYASRFRAGSDLAAWLMTIMHNVFVNDVMRPARTSTHIPVDEACVIEHGLCVEDNHARRLEMRDLDAALQQLPPEQREVVLLVGLEEMSYAQVAQALDVPVGTVMSRLSRARGKLRTLLMREEEGLSAK
jgi:RNA polymerase sigma-70 factor, ECF subfamily